jgi:cytochrome c oxidase subunit 2
MVLCLSACGGPRPPASTPEQVLSILELADADPSQREQLVAQGQKTFARMNCAVCHTTDGNARTGPSLQGLFDRPVTLATGQTLTPDRRYAWQSITQPTSQLVAGYQTASRMSNYGHLNDQDVASLIAYLETLSKGTQR